MVWKVDIPNPGVAGMFPVLIQRCFPVFHFLPTLPLNILREREFVLYFPEEENTDSFLGLFSLMSGRKLLSFCIAMGDAS